jgi:hypothetical protein
MESSFASEMKHFGSIGCVVTSLFTGAGACDSFFSTSGVSAGVLLLLATLMLIFGAIQLFIYENKCL